VQASKRGTAQMASYVALGAPAARVGAPLAAPARARRALAVAAAPCASAAVARAALPALRAAGALRPLLPGRGVARRASPLRAARRAATSASVAPPAAATAPGVVGVPISSLTVGVPKETLPSERRAAATPETVARLNKAGFTVLVESGLGIGSEISDDAYAAAGARVVSRAEALSADVVTKIRPFTPSEIEALKRGATTVSLLAPAQNKGVAEALAAQGVTALGLDCVPRTLSRAQAFDVLSSQANIAGFRAVMEAAHALPRRAPTAGGPAPRTRHCRRQRCARESTLHATAPQLTRAPRCRAPGRSPGFSPASSRWLVRRWRPPRSQRSASAAPITRMRAHACAHAHTRALRRLSTRAGSRAPTPPAPTPPSTQAMCRPQRC
jgi:hypothetical protein